MSPRRRPARTLGCLGTALVLVAGGGAAAYARGRGWIGALPVEPRCVFSGSSGVEVVLDLEQARLASVVAARSVALRLPPRAATIALATVYQESGIRNLDHGDRDSLGLFQQRPSKGWGTPAEVRDPAHAADTFYAALVKVPNWETADINDTAQTVQRSGVPQGYRKHETRARVLAEVLTGHRALGVRCVRPPRLPRGIDHRADAQPDALVGRMQYAFGPLKHVTSPEAETARIDAATPEQAWALAGFAVIHGPDHLLDRVEVRSNSFEVRAWWPGAWQPRAQPTPEVVVSRPRG